MLNSASIFLFIATLLFLLSLWLAPLSIGYLCAAAATGPVFTILSLIGWRGGDAALIGAACAIARDLSIGVLQERP